MNTYYLKRIRRRYTYYWLRHFDGDTQLRVLDGEKLDAFTYEEVYEFILDYVNDRFYFWTAARYAARILRRQRVAAFHRNKPQLIA
jgi:hypothetical protein